MDGVLTGNPVRDGSKKEAEMPMSNWTQLADEWLAKVNAARQLDVTVLPSINGIRDLPPTAETVIVDGFNTNQLPRVRKSSWTADFYAQKKEEWQKMFSFWKKYLLDNISMEFNVSYLLSVN